MWLAEQVKKASKKFFFVRTKIDQDLENERRSHRRTFVAEVVEETVRRDCIQKLEKDGRFHKPSVFLIDNFQQQRYDFPKLCLALIDALPQLKKEALTLSLHAFSNKMVMEKRNVLQKRIWIVSAISAAGALVPIPGVSLCVDTGLILHELTFYKEQFGLDDVSLAILSTKVTRGQEMEIGKIKSITEIGSRDNLMHLLRSYSQSIVAEEASRFIIGIGWLIASAISFATTYRMLNDQLHRLAKASDDIMALTLESMMKEEEYE